MDKTHEILKNPVIVNDPKILHYTKQFGFNTSREFLVAFAHWFLCYNLPEDDPQAVIKRIVKIINKQETAFISYVNGLRTNLVNFFEEEEKLAQSKKYVELHRIEEFGKTTRAFDDMGDEYVFITNLYITEADLYIRAINKYQGALHFGFSTIAYAIAYARDLSTESEMKLFELPNKFSGLYVRKKDIDPEIGLSEFWTIIDSIKVK